MQNLIKISRLASKEAIKDLKAKSPILCTALGKNFSVTNTFYHHILGYKKSRPTRETIERLVLINLIVKIATKGVLKETRKNQIFEGKIHLVQTYKICLKKGGINFFIILGEKESGNIILLSCFVKDFRKIET